MWELIVLCLVGGVVGQQEPVRGCGIQLVVDPLLWNHFKDQVKDKFELEEDEDEDGEMDRLARHEAIDMVSRLVNTANTVLFKNNNFGRFKYKLILKDIKILGDNDCSSLGPDLCSPSLSLQSLLDIYSYLPHDEFCLSYLLTYRSFSEGSLGLAWTATTGAGGVCENFRSHFEQGSHVEINKSLNTGVISLARNLQPVSEQVAAITFLHELGHSFGAQHDNGEECEPGGEEGNYLMFTTGSLGKRRRNKLLSPCSKRNITQVLTSHNWTGRKICWELDSKRGTCGNSVLEYFEECDCGHDPALCSAQCCVPPNDPSGRQGCTLAGNAQCSPTEGICCSSSCTFSPSSFTCSPSTPCSSTASCTGRGPFCPTPSSVADDTPCAGGSRTCSSGRCSGSVCQSLGMLPCSAPPTNDTGDSCKPHCHTQGGGCVPVKDLVMEEGVECEVGGGYGYCSAGGSCQVNGGPTSPAWITGLVIFLICYCIILSLFAWIYCRYCKGYKNMDIEITENNSSDNNSRPPSNNNNKKQITNSSDD